VTLFSIWTPAENKEDEEEKEEKPGDDKQDQKGKNKKNKDPKNEDLNAQNEEGDAENGPSLDDSITRWILQPGESKPLHIKFLSTKVGVFNQTLNFE